MKKGLWLLFLPTLSWAVGEGVPKVTPSTSTITINGAVQFSTTFSVTWSLLPGSYGAISSTGLYHATTGYFQAQNLSSAGTQLGPNDAIWNTDISGAPLDATSNAKIQYLFTVLSSSPRLSLQPTIPRNQYATGISSQAMVFRSNPQWDGTYFFMPSSFTRVQQASVMPNRPSELAQSGQDHHILGVSTDTLQAFEIFNFYPAGTDSAVPNSNCESGCIYDPNGYALPDTTGGHGTCTNAAGLMFQPFLLRNSELESGKINHTMFCTLDNGNNFNGFQWPATNSTNQCNDARCIKYGSLLRLKSTYGCTRFSPQAQAICEAMKTHGCINGDGGTVLAIVADYDLMQSTSDFNSAFTEFSVGTSSISSSDLDVIDVSGMMSSSFTANVNPSNGFVTPSPFVQVLAKNTVDGQVSSTTVALQPVVVGWQNPAHQGADAGVNVMAGTPQFTIPAWVTGSTDTSLTCSMTPTVGSIGTSSAGCLYTAPATQLNQVLITTVTVKSRIDPNHNSASFFLTVFSSDAIRVRDGPAISGADSKPPFDNNGNYTDSSTGNIFFETPTNMFTNWNSRSTQGDATWPNQMYNQYDYGSGDKLFTAMVPPGTYVLTSVHGRKDNSGGDVTSSSNCIESQNVLLVDTVSLAPAALTPKIITSTITVGSDSKFHWRIVGNSGSQLSVDNSHNFMSYWSLVSTTIVAVPSITSANTASGTVGQSFSYQITATNTPTSFDAPGLPTGITVDTVTGLISGVPVAVQTASTTISATNAGGTGTQALTITIGAAPPPPPPPSSGASESLQGHIAIQGKVRL